MSTPTTKGKVPAKACQFALDDDCLQFAAAEGKDKPTFEMQANSGRPILKHWWWGNLGIELSGIKCKKKMPVLVDHDSSQRIGFSTSVDVEDARGLVVRGELLPSSMLAQQVRQESREGFPWQASVNLRPLKIERIPEGETAEVNGHKIAGPGTVFRSSECREVSFTALGADAETSASALAGVEPAEDGALPEPDVIMSQNTTVPAAPPPAPDINAARAEASSAALSAERNRVSAIMKAAGPDNAELAQKLVDDGTPLADAMNAINAKLREKNAQLQAQLAAAPKTDKPLANGNTADTTNTPTPLDAAKALPEGKDKWAKLFDLDPALQAEFSSKDSYLAFMEAPAIKAGPQLKAIAQQK